MDVLTPPLVEHIRAEQIRVVGEGHVQVVARRGQGRRGDAQGGAQIEGTAHPHAARSTSPAHRLWRRRRQGRRRYGGGGRRLGHRGVLEVLPGVRDYHSRRIIAGWTGEEWEVSLVAVRLSINIHSNYDYLVYKTLAIQDKMSTNFS